jgi:AhpC/TSA antioxidant enzyme
VLSSKVDPAEVAAKDMQIAIIGCGDYPGIKNYAKECGCNFPIYADPTQKVYDTLGMIRTLALGDKKPEYMSFGVFGGIVKGIMNGIKAGSHAFKGGDIKQVGGE